ncbi:MAG: hypothetical protein HQL82_05215 [Magnetococcales bacterium]|nr:hypothetical protein [Magnetococcales bacterium]
MYRPTAWLPLILALFLLTLPVRAEEPLGRLLVFVNPVCQYCEAFEREVGRIYAKTPLGERLPIVRVDTLDPPEQYAAQASRVSFTPTFIVVTPDGHEQAVFRGYRGEEFFWSELERVARRLGFDPEGSR